MTAKDRVHRVVDEMTDQEADEALRYLASRGGDPVTRLLDEAPLEDEQVTDEEEATVREARDELSAHGTVALDDLRGELG